MRYGYCGLFLALLTLPTCSGLPVHEDPTFTAYHAEIDGEEGSLTAYGSVAGQWGEMRASFTMHYDEETGLFVFCLGWGDDPYSETCYTFETGEDEEETGGEI